MAAGETGAFRIFKRSAARSPILALGIAIAIVFLLLRERA
jgi:hypothetical protein